MSVKPHAKKGTTKKEMTKYFPFLEWGGMVSKILEDSTTPAKIITVGRISREKSLLEREVQRSEFVGSNQFDVEDSSKRFQRHSSSGKL